MEHRTLDLRPRNTTIPDVATELLAGRAAGVVLEPGDMTRYALLIAPCWEPLFHALTGGGVGDGGNYLLVATNYGPMYPIGRHAHAGYIGSKLAGGTSSYLHTGQVIAGFLDNLWRELDERSGEAEA